MKNEFKIAVILLVIFFFGGFLFGAEAPVKKITIEDVDAAVRDYVTNMSKADGMFHVQDDILNKTWNLKLRKVHKDNLTALDADTYFACADFKSDDATLIDVDFDLKNYGGKLVVVDTVVHKVSGEPRLVYEANGEYLLRIILSGKEPKQAEKRERSRDENSKPEREGGRGRRTERREKPPR